MATKKASHPAAVMSELMARDGLTDTELALAIKKPQSTIWRIKNRQQDTVSSEITEAIADYFKVSVDQILGRAPISGLTKLGNVTKLYPNQMAAKSLRPFYTVHSLSISKDGIMALTQEQSSVSADVSEEAIVFLVNDRSTEPDYVVGERIIVDPTITPKSEHDVLAYINGEAMLRRYIVTAGQVYLMSHNTNWPMGSIKLSGKDRIIGVVTSSIRNRLPPG